MYQTVSQVYVTRERKLTLTKKTGVTKIKRSNVFTEVRGDNLQK